MERPSPAHFDQVRLANRRRIRNLMREDRSFGKAELCELSGLSFPTVSALLQDLVQAGEVRILPEQETRGGRPAGRYALEPRFQVAFCAYIEDYRLHVRVFDVLGNTVEEEVSPLDQAFCLRDLLRRLDDLWEKYSMCSVISLGFPGVTENGRLTYIPLYPDLEKRDMAAILGERYSVPIFVENDVNVLVSAERGTWPDLFHLFKGANGPGAGILCGGSVLRGFSGGAGEVEYLPFIAEDGTFRTFCDELSHIDAFLTGEGQKEAVRRALLCAVFAAISIVNPADIALSGFGLTSSDLAIMQQALADRIPSDRIPTLHLIEDVDALYQLGLFQIARDYWISR